MGSMLDVVCLPFEQQMQNLEPDNENLGTHELGIDRRCDK